MMNLFLFVSPLIFVLINFMSILQWLRNILKNKYFPIYMLKFHIQFLFEPQDVGCTKWVLNLAVTKKALMLMVTIVKMLSHIERYFLKLFKVMNGLCLNGMIKN